MGLLRLVEHDLRIKTLGSYIGTNTLCAAESLHKEEAKGERFTDGKFPPNRSSLAPDGITVDPEWEEFTWRRISEISPDHEKKLFFKGISPKDITQGKDVD